MCRYLYIHLQCNAFFACQSSLECLQERKGDLCSGFHSGGLGACCVFGVKL